MLFTGSAGYLGQGIIIPFEQNSHDDLRLMDVRPFDTRHEFFVGDVADLAICRCQSLPDSDPIVTKRNSGIDQRNNAHRAQGSTLYGLIVPRPCIGVNASANSHPACSPQ